MENYGPCNNPDCQKCGNRRFMNQEPVPNYYQNDNPEMISRPPIPPPNRGHPPYKPGPCAPNCHNNFPPQCAPNLPPNLPPGPNRIEQVEDFDDNYSEENNYPVENRYHENNYPVDNGYIPENRYCGDANYIDDEITDEYLLNYLLKKYKIDKQKLIMMLRRSRESEYKYFIMKKFYKVNNTVYKLQFHEQYKIFKQWNNSGVYISKEDLENYYDSHIRNKN